MSTRIFLDNLFQKKGIATSFHFNILVYFAIQFCHQFGRSFDASSYPVWTYHHIDIDEATRAKVRRSERSSFCGVVSRIHV